MRSFNVPASLLLSVVCSSSDMMITPTFAIETIEIENVRLESDEYFGNNNDDAAYYSMEYDNSVASLDPFSEDNETLLGQGPEDELFVWDGDVGLNGVVIDADPPEDSDAALLVSLEPRSSIRGSSSPDTTEKKTRRRRHQLRRNTQQCNMQCFSNQNCGGACNRCINNQCVAGGGQNKCGWNCRNNFSVCNGSSNGCTQCNGSTCVSGGQQRCGQMCQNNPNICNGATDGCNVCNGSTCSSDNRGNQNKCNWDCRNNFNICNGSTNGCTQCDGSRCSFGGSPGGGQQRCGQMCRNNPNICNSATDGCRVCYGSTCTSGGAATCGTFCSNNNQCVNALNGCTTCQNGVCDGNRFINPGGNCVSNEQALRSRLQGGGTIDICPNANILVNGEIQTSRSYIDLRCSGGGSGCTIRGGSNMNTRLLYFTGSSITLQGIAFQSGSANGSGGAIKIDGTNNRITNCRFTGNKASQRGGAGSVGSATFVGNTYSGNYAAQCVNFFQSNTGSCFG